MKKPHKNDVKHDVLLLRFQSTWKSPTKAYMSYAAIARILRRSDTYVRAICKEYEQ